MVDGERRRSSFGSKVPISLLRRSLNRLQRSAERQRHALGEVQGDRRQRALKAEVPGWAFSRGMVKIMKPYLKGLPPRTPKGSGEDELPWAASGESEDAEEKGSSSDREGTDLKASLRKARDEVRKMEARVTKHLEQRKRKKAGEAAKERKAAKKKRPPSSPAGGSESEPSGKKKKKRRKGKRRRAKGGSPAEKGGC